MNRERQDGALVAPGRINDGFAPGGLRPNILCRHSVNPSLAGSFHVFAVIAYELEHDNWKAEGGGELVGEGQKL